MNKFVKAHAGEILENAYREIEYQIESSSLENPHFLAFVKRILESDTIVEEDLMELKGFVKGLKVALEIIQKDVLYALDENGLDVEFEDVEELNEFIRGEKEYY